MSPETQPATDEFLDEHEFGPEYEPPVSDNAWDARESDADTETSHEPGSIVEIANDNAFVLNGNEIINADGSSFTRSIEASGNIEAIMTHREIIRQWSEAQQLGFAGRQEAFLRDERVPDAEGETIYKTRMWLNPDGTGGYEIRSIRISAQEYEETNPMSIERASALETTVDAYPYDSERANDESEAAPVEARVAVATAEVEVQETNDAGEHVDTPTEVEPMVDVSEEAVAESTPDRDQEHASLLNDLLLERLPAFAVDEQPIDEAPLVILRTPDAAPRPIVPVVERADYQTSIEVPVVQETMPVSIPPSREKVVVFPPEAIVQIDKPVEAVAPETMRPENLKEIPAQPEKPVTVERPPAEQKTLPKTETNRAESRAARLELEAKKRNEKRIRRGRDWFVGVSRPATSHGESEEDVEGASRSVAEQSVTRMLKRFSGEALTDRNEASHVEVRDTPMAGAEVKHEARQPEAQKRSTPAPERAERQPQLDAEYGERDGENAAPASPEMIRSTLDEVLAAHHLSRTSVVEAASIFSQETISTTPGRHPHIADLAANDNSDDVIANRFGITMRRAA